MENNMNEDKIKEYVLNGGTLFIISSIDTIRDGGTKLINCTNGDTFYLHKDNKTLHIGGLPTDENKVDETTKEGELLINYFLERIASFVKKQGEEYLRNVGLLKELNIPIEDDIYLIEKGWIDPMENHNADGYNPFGFVLDKESADEFCEKGGTWKAEDCWSIPYRFKNNEMPKYKYIKIPLIRN